MDRLTQIEERLANATPGPWETRQHATFPGRKVVGPREPEDIAKGPVTLMEPIFWTERSAANAELIAAAPTDLAALVMVVRAVEALHRTHGPDDHGVEYCFECAETWPCPTAAAVQGLGEGS